MAQIIGTLSTSHIPAIGNAIAKGLQNEPYWKPFFDSWPPVREWLAREKPDVVTALRALLAQQPEARASWKSAPAEKPAAGAKPGKDRAAMFESRDTNHDGKLTREEFLLNQPDPDEAPKRFPKFDANNDGFLSREEFIHSGNVAKP